MTYTSVQALVDKGIRSTLVTNHHVVESCLSGNWLNRQVLVRAGTTECVGYVWTWDETVDLAAVYTTCDIPKVSGFTGTFVPKPEIGDVAITIGSAAGVAGTSTQGAIANITKDEILTTAQAAPGSSGGALFNRDGQLLGIVQGATGTLTVVIPITKFPDRVYAASVTVAWRT
jgi:S1-C subfamily serine protease